MNVDRPAEPFLGLTTNINVNAVNPITTNTNRHDGWFMPVDDPLGRDMRDELGRMMRELGW